MSHISKLYSLCANKDYVFIYIIACKNMFIGRISGFFFILYVFMFVYRLFSHHNTRSKIFIYITAFWIPSRMINGPLSLKNKPSTKPTYWQLDFVITNPKKVRVTPDAPTGNSSNICRRFSTRFVPGLGYFWLSRLLNYHGLDPSWFIWYSIQ